MLPTYKRSDLQRDKHTNLEFDGLADPNRFLYSSSTISSKFRNGIELDETLQDLKRGTLNVFQIPPIRVINYKNHWYCLDNRRLWVFKQLGEVKVPVRIVGITKEFWRKKPGDGKQVQVVREGEARYVDRTLLFFYESLCLASPVDLVTGSFMTSTEVLQDRYTLENVYFRSWFPYVLGETLTEIGKGLSRLEKVPYPTFVVYASREVRRPRKHLLSIRLTVGEGEERISALKEDTFVIITKTKISSIVQITDDVILGVVESVQLKEGKKKVWSLEVYTFIHEEDPEFDVLFNSPSFMTAICSLETKVNIWKALQQGQLPPAISKYILGTKTLLDLKMVPPLANVSRECECVGLDDEKKGIISTVVAQEEGVFLLTGPPGTGKTKSLLAMAAVLVDLERKVQVVVPHNELLFVIVKQFLNLNPNKKMKPSDIAIIVDLNKSHPFGDQATNTRILKLKELFKEWEEIYTMLKLPTNTIPKPAQQKFTKIVEDFSKVLRQKIDLPSTWNTSSLMEMHVTLQHMLDEYNYENHLKTAKILFSTSTAPTNNIAHIFNPTVLLVDEVVQIVEPELLLSFSSSLKLLVLSADPEQNLPTIHRDDFKEKGYYRSLFNRLLISQHCFTLSNQYRADPSLLLWTNKKTYNGKITSPIVAGLDVPWRKELLWEYITFLNLHESEEEQDEFGNKTNTYEANIVKLITDEFFNEHKKYCVNIKLKYGVITPYQKQVVILKKKLQQHINEGFVSVRTLDECQGDEFEVVVFSTVRTNRKFMELLQDKNKINVALTRAKCSLLIIGNESALKGCSYWHELIEYLKKNNNFREVNQIPFLKAHGERAQVETLMSKKKDIMGMSPWVISFSNNAKKSFSKDLIHKKSLINTITELLKGPKENKEKSRLRVAKTGDHGLIWSVDVDRASFKQIIKIWDIVHYSVLGKVTQNYQNGFQYYSKEYKKMCDSCEMVNGHQVPKQFDEIPNFRWNEEQKPERFLPGVEQDAENSVLLTKFYYLSNEVFDSILHGYIEHTELPFTLNLEEEKLVKLYDNFFLLGRSGTGKTTVILMKILNRAITAQEKKESALRQIFITKSPLLCKNVYDQYESLRTNRKVHADNLLSDINTDYFKKIPNNLKDVKLENAPLFVTFEKLLQILNGTIGQKEEINLEDKYINFPKFKNLYWRGFNQNLVKKHSPEVVYTEIMSVIKGDKSVFYSATGFMDREAYTSKEVKRSSIVDDELSRSEIYDLFEAYKKKKKERNEFDLCDYTFKLFSMFTKKNYGGPYFDCVYIDEAQDFSTLELTFLKFIGRYPNSYIFAGDTAQTIAQGINFRFEDLQELFWTQFKPHFRNKIANLPKPERHQLLINYRTHMGILNIAAIVVELIYHFFPYSIDKLSGETSSIGGCLPILYYGNNEVYKKNEEDLFGLGANQVILVRNNETKQALKEEFGDIGLILTIMEAKGLEFNDVLIYQFWRDSPVKHWKVILDYLDSDKQTNLSPKEKILCQELKQLYVAITRTRSMLWFYEDDHNAVSSIEKIWKDKNAVLTDSLKKDELMKKFGKKSTVEEWNRRGLNLFENGLFHDAVICFTRGDNEKMLKRTKAEILRVEAQQYEEEDKNLSYLKYEEMAYLFVELNEWRQAASGFFSAHKYEESSEYYIKVPLFKEAANCNVILKRWEVATKLFFDGQLFKEGLDLSLNYCMRYGFELLKSVHKTMDSAMVDTYCLQYANKVYAIQQERPFFEDCVSLITDVKKRNKFLLERKEYVLLKRFSINEGDFWNAGNYSEFLGEMNQASSFYLKANDKETALQSLCWIVFAQQPLFKISQTPMLKNYTVSITEIDNLLQQITPKGGIQPEQMKVVTQQVQEETKTQKPENVNEKIEHEFKPPTQLDIKSNYEEKEIETKENEVIAQGKEDNDNIEGDEELDTDINEMTSNTDLSIQSFTLLKLEVEIVKRCISQENDLEGLKKINQLAVEYKHSFIELWTTLKLAFETIKNVNLLDQSCAYLNRALEIIDKALHLRSLDGNYPNLLSFFNIQYNPKDQEYYVYALENGKVCKSLLNSQNLRLTICDRLINIKNDVRYDLFPLLEQYTSKFPKAELKVNMMLYKAVLHQEKEVKEQYTKELINFLFPANLTDNILIMKMRLRSDVKQALKDHSFPFLSTIIHCSKKHVRQNLNNLDISKPRGITLIQNLMKVKDELSNLCELNVNKSFPLNIKSLKNDTELTFISLLEHYSVLMLCLVSSHVYIPDTLAQNVLPGICSFLISIKDLYIGTTLREELEGVVYSLEKMIGMLLRSFRIEPKIYCRLLNLYLVLYTTMGWFKQQIDNLKDISRNWKEVTAPVTPFGATWRDLLLDLTKEDLSKEESKVRWVQTAKKYDLDILTIALKPGDYEIFGKYRTPEHFFGLYHQ